MSLASAPHLVRHRLDHVRESCSVRDGHAHPVFEALANPVDVSELAALFQLGDERDRGIEQRAARAVAVDDAIRYVLRAIEDAVDGVAPLSV
jgi:hypothetical protein